MASVDRAVEELRDRILAGEFAGGVRLGEVEIAGELGMSRTPVRQALLRLAAEGLVEIAPNRGARVIARSDAELEYVFEMRARLEGLAARQAATRATPEQLDLLDTLAHQLAEYAAERDTPMVTKLNARFHGTLLEIGESVTLGASVSGLMHASVMARTQSSFDEAAFLRRLRADDPARGQSPHRDRRRVAGLRRRLGRERDAQPSAVRAGVAARPAAAPTGRRYAMSHPPASVLRCAPRSPALAAMLTEALG